MFKRLVEYLSHSSIHGLHYITDEKRHISERIFWAVVCFACLLGACLVWKGNIYNYENNAVSFVMETTYLKWNTTFPAISVCEFESSEKINDIVTKIYGTDRNMNLDFYLREISFYNGHCYTCSAHCGKTINCSQDFDGIVKMIRYPCNELIGECKFNGVPFKCCRHFRLLKTEKGPCYTINSMHLKKPKLPLDMTSNKNTGPGKLEFMANENVNILLHAPEDVPYLNHPLQEKEAIPWGSIFNMRFKVSEIENDPYVKQVSISQRNCRFPSENYLRSYKLFSYSACVVDCRVRNQIKYCNCTHHFMSKIDGVETCDLAGLNCLSGNQDKLKSLRTADYSGKVGLVCDCMSSCTEPEYTVISKTIRQNNQMNQTIYGDYGTKISIVLDSLPKEQFKRKVVRTSLDLIVSMGGTIGFFLGASLLSITEFFYYFFIRKMIPKNNPEAKLIQSEILNDKIASIMLKKVKVMKAERKRKTIPFKHKNRIDK